jgi:hypothetical protein
MFSFWELFEVNLFNEHLTLRLYRLEFDRNIAYILKIIELKTSTDG